jgi:hypothetical protein
MAFPEQLSQALAVMGQLPCSNHTTNTDTQIAAVDMSILRRLITYADVGVVNTAGVGQLFYKSSANANMAGSTNTLGAATSVTFNTSNRVESIEVRADQLPAGHRYVQPVLVVSGSTMNVGLLVLGGESSYKPASAYNVTNVLDQSVVV